jgi:hypothetical protein
MVNCRPPWARATLKASTQTVTPAGSFLKPGEKKSPAAISDMCGLKVARCPARQAPSRLTSLRCAFGPSSLAASSWHQAAGSGTANASPGNS